MKELLAIGAGPKALAVAAKAHVLRHLGIPAPHVTIVESDTVGGNWLPSGGWTDGQHRLGTSPEKDLGFPYHSTWARGRGRAIDEAMTAYSWRAYLIDHGTYAEWIDRGRPSPPHHSWAKYLQWAAGRMDVEIVSATATSIATDAHGWRIGTTAGDLAAQALMITGPGSSRTTLAPHPKLLSIAEFWNLVCRREVPVSSRVAVIGGGETAGSALDELVRHGMLSISVISPNATIYTRGESYFENTLFSDPSRWSTLSATERREVIRRTDRGVFSTRVQESLLADNRVHHLQGRVVRVADHPDGVALTLRTETMPDRVHTVDLAVDATGGQPLWFLDLFDPNSLDLLELAVRGPLSRSRLEDAIGHDLSVTGLAPKLFLPGLAGVAQGPGFPNLSCLGALSDRILRETALQSAAAERNPAHATRVAVST
ncbi:SidA/IucD/PvdA family monooxygenase [Nocardia stercoris]|uniref:L-lysine N6-monooxygenase MbtG n=1 Tax=Nocardia stercoris TaxID=2483361 RepID=A0A3M2KUP8_9NOCA|nr:SidA/IucD/PvdA family monooxygenase [Nocardia stercoris]RMI28376.1 lysine 6-monooxygenase [Nocardia stercoris]